MKKETIQQLFKKFEQACILNENIECWSARDLQEALGYSEWRNSLNVIQKAKIVCKNDSELISDHFNALCLLLYCAKREP